VEGYRINIVGLSNKIHQFEYEIGDEFFARFGSDLISRGSFRVDVEVNKHETFLEVTFDIEGNAVLVCDRSLEEFEYPIKTKNMMVFKYGDEDREITEEVVMIQRDTPSLELGQLIYEFISLAVPMKRLHPRFASEQDSDSPEEGKIVYTSAEEKNNKEEEVDPRWEKLKKLK
jgi:uncharacterized metal-binding protein YceD (DUF177 family)